MFSVLWLVLVFIFTRPVSSQRACNATIDNFGTEALSQGLQTTLGSYQGAFGEQLVGAVKPSVHIRPKGAITTDLEVFSYGNGGCTSGYVYTCYTGNTSYGYGVLRSVYPTVYHPGESTIGRWTQALPTPCSEGDCLLAGGLFTTTDGFLIGLKNNVFSVGYQHHGQVEMRTLTVTAAATVGSTVTVTVSGTAVVVTLTVATAATNALEIANALTAATLPRAYYFEQVGNLVLATGKSTDEVVGSFAYAAGTTGSAASWVQNAAAQPKIEQWVTRANMEGASAISFLNETSTNIYQIIYGYLGVANIQYMVLNPLLGKFVTMHVIRPANAITDVSIRQPSMKIGWIAYRPTLGTANYQIIGGSAQLSRIEFFDEFILPTWGSNVDVASVTAASEKYAMSLRAQRTSNSHLVLSIVRILKISANTDSTKGALFRVFRNCVITGTPNWQFVSSTQSVVTVDKVATGCTGGELVMTGLVGATSATTMETTDLSLIVPQGETLTVMVQLISGAASEVNIAVSWSEDY